MYVRATDLYVRADPADENLLSLALSVVPQSEAPQPQRVSGDLANGRKTSLLLRTFCQYHLLQLTIVI